MSKLKALVTAEIIPEVIESLSDKIHFVYDGYNIDHNVMPHSELAEKISQYDILISEYDTIDKQIFDNAKNLKMIICCRGGVKSVVDIDEAMSHGVIVCNNAGRNAGAVSDMTIAYILDLTRNISYTNNLIHNRKITSDLTTKPSEYKDTVWGLNNDSPFIKYRGKSINHMKLGLVGLGHAGQLVAYKAKAFGMEILGYDPYVDEETLPNYIKKVTFDELLADSDIISLHCVYTPQTKYMFSKNTFLQMKKGSYFINTSRGGLVNEDDLVEALNNGYLSGAALDVTDKEPISANSPLLDAKNLIITPHIAGSSYDVQVVGSEMVLESLETYLAGKKPANCVVYK